MRTIATVLAATLLIFSVSVSAQSQCVGLSSSQCSANDSCSWRKASVNKNNVKTKAHCRALPNKAKKSVKKKSISKPKKKASVDKKKSTVKKKPSTLKEKASAKKKSSTAKKKTSLKKKASKSKDAKKVKAKK